MTNTLDWLSHDIHSEKLAQIQQLMPELFKEGKLDPQALKNFFWDNHDKEERYGLWWAGKSGVFKVIKDRTSKTLHPEQDKSVDWDTTQNLFIEGDNLDVLKILQKSYYNKIKMIYIDPPYNTGSDAFVYPDDYSMSTDQYNELAGDLDDDGNIRKDDNLRKNSKDSGRYHSNWLSMMYSRLYLARNLLTDDGVIFVSIDENEIHNLTLLMNEVLGEENFVEQFIWIKNSTKNNSKTTSTNHEYILCYAKNKSTVEEKQIFRIKKPGLQEVYDLLESFEKRQLSIQEAEKELKEFYKSRPDLKWISSYNKVEYVTQKSAPEAPRHLQAYTIDNASAPVSSWTGPIYDIIHPKTGRPCVCPSTGRRYTRATMDEHIKNWLIYFYEDETKVPRFKRFLDTVETEVLKSTFEDFTDWKKELLKLFDFNPFDNPKPTTVLQKLLAITNPTDIILDFFSWSGTTAHAVMDLNAQDGGNRKYIMVQYPEDTDEWSEAYKAGYKTIPEIARERIRRAGQKTMEDHNDTLASRETPLDIGFKSFVVWSSNFKQRRADKIDDQTLFGSLEDHLTLIKSHSTPLSMLYELILKHGVSLTEHITTQTFAWKEYFDLWNGSLIVCLETELTQELIDHLLTLGARLILLDEWFNGNDALLKNTHLQCQHNGITLHTL